jgi:replicative superfamily II helicase
MMFPRPTSSRTLVRQTLSATISELAHILSVEIEALLAEEVRLKEGHYEKVEFVGNAGGKVSAKEKRVRKIAQKVLFLAVSGYPCLIFG